MVPLKQTMVDSVMVPGKHTNCKQDLDDFLLSLSSTKKASPVVLTSNSVSAPYVQVVATLPAEMRNMIAVCYIFSPEKDTLSKTEINVLSYISGYILRKLRAKMCESCLARCIAHSTDQDGKNVEFIRIKKYEEARDGLIYPSPLLQDVLSKVEARYREVIDDAIFSQSIKLSLVSTFEKMDTLGGIECECCQFHKLFLHIFVNIRLHHTLRLCNNDLRVTRCHKNRKALKFSHL